MMADIGIKEDSKRERYGESTVAYPEPFTKIPPPVSEKKPGQLTQQEIQQFFEEGYVIVRDYFQPEELQPCRDAMADLVEEMAQKLYKAGKIDRLYEEYGLFQRFTEINKVYPEATILMFKQGKFPKALMDLWCCEKLVNMNEQLLGPDVAGHPVWNLRVKAPHCPGTDVPWHQDSAYFSEDSYDHLITIAWIPFLDTHADNGGMEVMKNSQRVGKVARHTCCPGDSWFVDLSEEDMKETLEIDLVKDRVTCEVPYGGFLLFNNITAHRSLHNISNDIRFSVDLRWQSPHQKWGFYDIAEGVIFRDKEQGIVKPDFEKFLSINRKAIWQKRHYKKVIESDEFDTIVTGPWFGRWETVHENRHTQAFKRYTQG